MEINILGISGSPRKNSNTDVMIAEALKGAEEIQGVQIELFSLGGKKMLPCTGCFKCVEKKELCIFRDTDAMADFYEKWFHADGVIIGSPVYHATVSGILKNALDRLSQGLFAAKFTSVIKSGWYFKVGGVLSQGMARWGGQELTVQFLTSHLLLMNCLVVPAETTTAPGVCGSFNGVTEFEGGTIADYDAKAMQNARAMGKRVAEVTRIVKAGVADQAERLPDEYRAFVTTKDGFKPIKIRKKD